MNHFSSPIDLVEYLHQQDDAANHNAGSEILHAVIHAIAARPTEAVGIHNAGGLQSGQQLPWSYDARVLTNSTALQFSNQPSIVATTTMLASSLQPSILGQSVTFTAVVNPAPKVSVREPTLCNSQPQGTRLPMQSRLESGSFDGFYEPHLRQ